MTPRHDTLALLTPYDRRTQAPSGAHPGKTFHGDGTVTAYEARHHYAFLGRRLVFRGPREQHAALVDAAMDESGFVCRADLGHDLPWLRRIKDRRGSCPAGLRRIEAHSAPLDFDKIPNIRGLDPRKQGQEAADWLLKLLGDEIATATGGWWWSSSCCVDVLPGLAPATLSARAWLCLDTPLEEKALSQLFKRLDARLRVNLAGQGADLSNVTAMLLDFKVAEAQQPIYIVKPRFEAHRQDPFLNLQRQWLLEGDRDYVRLDRIGDLPPPTRLIQARKNAAEAVSPGQAKVVVLRTSSEATAAPLAPYVMPPGAPELVQVQLRTIAAMFKARHLDSFEKFQMRGGWELIAIILDSGGVGVGNRNAVATIVASFCAASLPLRLPNDEVRAAIADRLRLIISAEWVERDWLGKRYDASILGHYERASAGETTRIGRDVRDVRFTYLKERTHAEFGVPTRDQVHRLNLISLAKVADLKAAQRKHATAEKQREKQARETELADLLRDQLDAGLSIRKAALVLGLSKSRAAELLAVSGKTQLGNEMLARAASENYLGEVGDSIASDGMSSATSGSDVAGADWALQSVLPAPVVHQGGVEDVWGAAHG